MKHISKLFILLPILFAFKSLEAEDLPYFDPYSRRFETIQTQKIYESENIIIFSDVLNKKKVYKETFEWVVKTIEKDLLVEFQNLFNPTGIEITLPIYFIFTEKLSYNQDLSFAYHAYYTSSYKEEHGFEAILVNPKSLQNDGFLYYLAHELFHLFYHQKNKTPPVWIDEGLAQLFGYIMSGSDMRTVQPYIKQYFLNQEVALEEFPNGQTQYYGHSFLFFYYIYYHYIKNPEDLRLMIEVDHPKELFSEEGWQIVLQNFSIAKFLNTQLMGENNEFSLQPVRYSVTALETVREDLEPKPNLNFYFVGSLENIQKVEALKTQFKKQKWDTEIIYIVDPKFGYMTHDKTEIEQDLPYYIIFNIYSQNKD